MSLQKVTKEGNYFGILPYFDNTDIVIPFIRSVFSI